MRHFEGLAPAHGGTQWAARPVKWAARLLAAAWVLLALAACDQFRYPRDPNDTLERVLATNRMRVVAVDHVPWVVIDGERAPTGAEPELVEAFARELGAVVDWRRAPAFEAIDALQHGDADLAIGGFTRRAVSAHKHAAATHAYFTDALIVAVEPGFPVPEELDGEAVHADPDLMVNGLIEEKGGVPVPRDTEEVHLVALPHWQAIARGLLPTGITLTRAERVMAVPRGENAWLMRLDAFLREHAHQVDTLLLEHAS